MFTFKIHLMNLFHDVRPLFGFYDLFSKKTICKNVKQNKSLFKCDTAVCTRKIFNLKESADFQILFGLG